MKEMTNQEASDLFQALNKGAFAGLKGAKFNYALVRTKDILKRELALLEESFKEKEKFIEYESKRIAIAKDLCEKDEKGQPVIDQNRFKLSEENDVKFKEKLEELQTEYTDALEERTQQMESFNKMLEENISFEIHRIGINDIPEEITQEQMEILYPMIMD
jgi:hypothetical protein